jgi:hypothetical protein
VGKLKDKIGDAVAEVVVKTGLQKLPLLRSRRTRKRADMPCLLWLLPPSRR